MGLVVVVDGVQSIETGIWRAQIDPRDVVRLRDWSAERSDTTSPLHGGERSLILIEDPVYRENEQSLEFDPHRSQPIIVGNNNEVLLIDAMSRPGPGAVG